MDAPSDFNDAFYTRLKGEISEIILNIAVPNNAGAERTMQMIVSHCRAEKGFSQELVRSMPIWKNRYDNKKEETPKNDGEKVYGNNNADKMIHSMSNVSTGDGKPNPNDK